MTTRVALTLDDAPTVVEPGVPADPKYMDAMLQTLQQHGVRSCVAFVVGHRAHDHKDAMRRWLDAGFELGNHTFGHERASSCTTQAFLESVEKCHALLMEVGAFDAGRMPFFRFPYLDRGADPSQRVDIQRGCEALGYRLAPATVDFCDHRFDLHFARAIAGSDHFAADRVRTRYRAVARESLQGAAARLERRFRRVPPLVSYCHFGPISTDSLGAILTQLERDGVELCTLDAALEDSVYASFNADAARSGLVTFRRSIARKVAVRLARASERAGAFGQASYGPRWPYL